MSTTTTTTTVPLKSNGSTASTAKATAALTSSALAITALSASLSDPLDPSDGEGVARVPEDARLKKHHAKGGSGFENPWDSFKNIALTDFFRRMIWRKITGEQNNPDTTPPTVGIRTPVFLPTRETPRLRTTWLGHACFYVEFPSGLRVLFDPVFEDCCAPVEIKRLKRYTPVPCEIEDLPVVDAVVISHNHYDHLSYPTIKRIQKKFPDAHFFAPLGNREWFLKSGVAETNVTEMDWWEARRVTFMPGKGNAPAKVDSPLGSSTNTAPASTSTSTPPATTPHDGTITAVISALPCQHASARGPFDRYKTLWASWSVESNLPSSESQPAAPGQGKVYFAGDTGYRSVPHMPKDEDDWGEKYAHLPVCPAFKQIGELRGPFGVGLIPVGAYEPRSIMSPIHANPTDAVHIFRDTRCERALGMHWGTWVLTEEDVLEPPRKLAEALTKLGVGEKGKEGETFGVCEIGESREF